MSSLPLPLPLALLFPPALPLVVPWRTLHPRTRRDDSSGEGGVAKLGCASVHCFLLHSTRRSVIRTTIVNGDSLEVMTSLLSACQHKKLPGRCPSEEDLITVVKHSTISAEED